MTIKTLSALRRAPVATGLFAQSIAPQGDCTLAFDVGANADADNDPMAGVAARGSDAWMTSYFTPAGRDGLTLGLKTNH